jgi:hypothetical protein
MPRYGLLRFARADAVAKFRDRGRRQAAFFLARIDNAEARDERTAGWFVISIKPAAEV